MERRNLFRILGATTLSKAAEAVPPPPYVAKFLKPDQAAAVTRLADILLPADGQSPGAEEAGVIRYIDLMLQYAEVREQSAWRTGLDAVEAEAQRGYRKAFGQLTRSQQEAVVATMAKDEGQRTDPLGAFFVPLKRLAVEAYHYSEAHWKKNMGRGLTVALAKFPDCTS